MNTIAGIFIGAANQSWIYVVIASLVWGCVFCIYQTINGYKERFIEWSITNHRDKKNPRLIFYFIEYMTAFTTSLFAGIIVFFLKKLIF